MDLRSMPPAASSEPADDGSGESPDERRNRELMELLNELRVALPGVQVLFAFLLTVPFSGRFGSLTSDQRAVFFATFVGTAVATAMFMAPTAYHRIRFRQGDKERMLRTSNRFAIAGTVALALSIALAVMMTTDVMFGLPIALGAAFAALLLLWWAWFMIPLARRARDGGGRPPSD